MNVVQTVKTDKIQIVLLKHRGNWYTTWCSLEQNLRNLFFHIDIITKKQFNANTYWRLNKEYEIYQRPAMNEKQARKRFSELIKNSEHLEFKEN